MDYTKQKREKRRSTENHPKSPTPLCEVTRNNREGQLLRKVMTPTNRRKEVKTDHSPVRENKMKKSCLV